MQIKFTKREIEVAKLLLLRNEEIAGRLLIASGTVSTYIQNLREKTGTKSKAGIIVKLLKAGKIKLNEIVEVNDAR